MWEMAENLMKDEAADLELLGERIKGPYSFSCAYIDKIPSCKELVEGIIGEAEELLETWEFLKTR